MKIHELKTTKKKTAKRAGRGTGSGMGKTAGRGMDGQNSRSGGSVRPGFEGGQNPYMKRIPKSRGFKNYKIKPEVVHTDQLNRFGEGEVISIKELKKAGIVSKQAREVKLLNRGKLDIKLDVIVDKSSESAAKTVSEAGGSVKTGRK